MTVASKPAHAAASVRRWIFAAPGTHIYLLILLITTETVRSLHPTLASQLLRQASTNLTEMGRSSGRVLLLSAFLLDDGHWLPHALLLSAVYVPLERWAGSVRWLTVIAAGHIGATLVTTVGIWADVHSNRSAVALTHAIDVGVSYGLFAGAAFLTFGFGQRLLRLGARVALLGVVGYPLVRFHTFSDAGHIAAVAIGGACYAVLEPRLRKQPKLRMGDLRERTLGATAIPFAGGSRSDTGPSA